MAGPGLVLDAIRLTAQGWRRRPARVLWARWLIAARQSVDGMGGSISAATTSTSPSRIWFLPSTWWYSEAASTPSSRASRRIVTASRPSSSAMTSATCSVAFQVQRRPVGDLGRPTAHGFRLSGGPSCSCRRPALDNLTPLE